MNDSETRFPHSGRSFLVTYGDDLAAVNAYSADGETVAYEIVQGPYTGAKGEAPFRWTRLPDGSFLVSWQEADGSTVVHHEDFDGEVSHAFFTTPAMQFFRLSGTVREMTTPA